MSRPTAAPSWLGSTTAFCQASPHPIYGVANRSSSAIGAPYVCGQAPASVMLLDHLDARVGQHRVERGRKLSRSVADQEPDPPGVFVQGVPGGTGSACLWVSIRDLRPDLPLRLFPRGRTPAASPDRVQRLF